MTNKHSEYNNMMAQQAYNACDIQPLTAEEKAELKIRIMLAINANIA